MQSLKYAFRFIDVSFSLVFQSPAFQKSLLYLLLGCFGLLMIWFLPLALVAGFIGLGPLGLILIGLLSLFAAVSLHLWGQITAIRMSKIINTLLQENTDVTEIESAKGLMDSHWFEILKWALSLPGLQVIDGVRRLLNPRSEMQLGWLDAHYLILPVISIEESKLAQAVDRVKGMVRENLLRFRSDLIGVGFITKIVEWFSLISGIVLGFAISMSLFDPLSANIYQRILGAFIGLLLGGIFTILGISFSTIIRACYQTALYRWGLNIENTRKIDSNEAASPPLILRKVLGFYSSKKKE